MEEISLLISQQDSAGIGGAEILNYQLTKELIGKKINISIILVKNSILDGYYKDLKAKIIKVPYRMNVFGGWKGLIKFVLFLPHSIIVYYNILKIFKDHCGDIVFIPGFSDKLIMTPIAKILNLKVVWFEHSPIEPVFRRNLYIPKILYFLVKSLPDLVLVPSENTYKQYLVETKINPRKVKIIKNGLVILSKQKIDKYKNEKNKTKLRFSVKNKYLIGMVSRLEEEKGQETLIKSIKYIKKSIDDFVVIIVGAGKYMRDLKVIVKKEKVKKYVVFTGFVSNQDKWKLYATFDVFVFPTRWKLEGFGFVPLEAMMMGVPVVASNFGPVPEVVGDGGLLVEPTPKAIANGIIKILKNKKLAARLARRGQKRVFEKFDIEKVADRYLEEIMRITASYAE